MNVWTPAHGQTLLLKHEPTNISDSNAVGAFLYDTIVGHVSFHKSGAKLSSTFEEDVNKVFCLGHWREGEQRKRLGLEISCFYCLYELQVYKDKMK